MTVITVKAPAGRISRARRGALATSLTDAVLVPEIGQFVEAARAGFQVHFSDLDTDCMAIGGRLVSVTGADIMVVDICVMDGDWPQSVRAEVIGSVLTALAQALGEPKPPPGWWATFRVIEEGSWGSRGGVLSILDLLNSGVFTDEKQRAIRARFKA